MFEYRPLMVFKAAPYFTDTAPVHRLDIAGDFAIGTHGLCSGGAVLDVGGVEIRCGSSRWLSGETVALPDSFTDPMQSMISHNELSIYSSQCLCEQIICATPSRWLTIDLVEVGFPLPP